MKPITALLLTVFVNFGLVLSLINPSPVFAQTTTFTIGSPNETLFNGKFMGFGAELDPFFWNTPNTNPDVIGNPKNITGVNEADWQIITQRIKDMKIPIVRMAMQLGWATRDPDLNTWLWDNPQMKSVFRYLDFACANNIDVIIDDWAWTARSWDEAGVSFPNCNTYPNNKDCVKANNGYVDETDTRFAKGIAMYMKEFLNRGYSCVKYLIVSNEPEYEFYAGNNRTYEQGLQIYETMTKNVDQAMKDQGIRSQIKFIGPDNGGGWDFFADAISRLHGVFDLYDFHRYPGPTCGYPNPPCSGEITNINPPGGIYGTLYRMLEAMRNMVYTSDPTTGTAKQMFVTEMGLSSGATYTNGQNVHFEYALEMADYATTLLTSRVQGGIFWNMFDLYYSLDQNIYQNPPYYGANFFEWGLWKYKDNNWALRPSAQSWGLLTRFAPRDSIQAPVNGCPDCSGLPNELPPISPYRVGALKRPDGGWSVFMVNEASSTQTFNLQFPARPVNSFSQYRYDSNTMSQYPNTVAIPPIATNVAVTSQNLSVSMPAKTFMVLVENTSSLSPTPSVSCKTYDINCDGSINTGDLFLVLRNLNTANSLEDLNKDGKVNIPDAGLVVKNWGL